MNLKERLKIRFSIPVWVEGFMLTETVKNNKIILTIDKGCLFKHPCIYSINSKKLKVKLPKSNFMLSAYFIYIYIENDNIKYNYNGINKGFKGVLLYRLSVEVFKGNAARIDIKDYRGVEY